MEKISLDQRMLVGCMRYAIGRQTGLIDLAVDELRLNIKELKIWLLESAISDMLWHLQMEDVNKGYAREIGLLCIEELKKRKVLVSEHTIAIMEETNE